MKMYWSIVALLFVICTASARPQEEELAKPEPLKEEYKPMPYEYSYKVEDAENSVYYGKTESGNEAGRVEGEYYVLLPDNRLMKVVYYVDGDSGFMPKITFVENGSPFSGGNAAAAVQSTSETQPPLEPSTPA